MKCQDPSKTYQEDSEQWSGFGVFRVLNVDGRENGDHVVKSLLRFATQNFVYDMTP